jgi:hypothetical protein
MTGQFYFPETTGPGAAFLDFDGDGDLDVLLLQGALLGPAQEKDTLLPVPEGGFRGRLFRNDLRVASDGTRQLRFTDVTAASGLRATGYSMGVATGDFDQDGWTDLYLTNYGSNQLWRNRGDGTFEDVTARAGVDDSRWSVPAVFFDYDQDGWPDLYVGNYVRFTVAGHKLCRAESGAPDYCGPMAYAPEEDRLFHNRGDGTFEDVTLASGLAGSAGAALGAIPADFDGDGWLDLYVANDGSENFLWRGRGDGTFENLALLAGCAVNMDGQPQASMGVDAGDFDQDGDEDLFMTHLNQETNTLYRNDGHGFFEDVSRESGVGAASWSYTGFGTAWFDYDGDGWLDLFVANGAVEVLEDQRARGDVFPLKQRNQLFHGRGDGKLEEVTDAAGEVFELEEVSRAAAFGDVDNDGDTDILLANNSGPARLLLNQVGNRAAWLGLHLLAGTPPREQPGAWVGVLRNQQPTLWRRVRTAGSFGAANDPRLLFGLGKETAIAGVEVRWPDGAWEHWPAIELGRYHDLPKGSGRPGRAP